MTSTDKESKEKLSEFRTAVENEPISTFLGMKLVELEPGYAKVSMKMRPEYLTFNGYIFGGIITCLADQAFACAANSVGRMSIATQFNSHFISGPKPDDLLIAECRFIRKGRRVDICEMTVTNDEGKLIATATGTAIPTT